MLDLERLQIGAFLRQIRINQIRASLLLGRRQPAAARRGAADIQDRDGAPAVLASRRHAFPWLRHVFADGAYRHHDPAARAMRHGDSSIVSVRHRNIRPSLNKAG